MTNCLFYSIFLKISHLVIFYSSLSSSVQRRLFVIMSQNMLLWIVVWTSFADSPQNFSSKICIHSQEGLFHLSFPVILITTRDILGCAWCVLDTPTCISVWFIRTISFCIFASTCLLLTINQEMQHNRQYVIISKASILFSASFVCVQVSAI